MPVVPLVPLVILNHALIFEITLILVPFCYLISPPFHRSPPDTPKLANIRSFAKLREREASGN